MSVINDAVSSNALSNTHVFGYLLSQFVLILIRLTLQCSSLVFYRLNFYVERSPFPPSIPSRSRLKPTQHWTLQDKSRIIFIKILILILLLLTFNVTKTQSIKDHTFIAALRQCWTVSSCQTLKFETKRPLCDNNTNE